MGFVLFTASGTFKPSDYGLLVGDAIQVVCVGGGGGGGGHRLGTTRAAATNGLASSFGSYVTALGGNAGSCSTSSSISSPTNGANAVERGTPGHMGEYRYVYIPYNFSSGATYYIVYAHGGNGGNGWLPGVGVVEHTPTEYNFLPSNIAGKQTPVSGGRGNVGGSSGSSGSGNTYFNAGGLGGIGYGAGGGGCSVNQSPAGGGGGGQVTYATVVLTDVTTGITVTCGDGGTGCLSDYSQYYGGGGARGCVAVFW